VIVTGAGATGDFCNPETAFLVPSGLRRMSEKLLDDQPTLDYPGYLEPEMEALVAWMRHVYSHPEAARITAKAGMHKIRNEFTWDHAAEIAGERLAAVEKQPILRRIAK
jgi:hypothetical protein